MANTLTSVIPKLLAQGLLALRERAIMPRLVNRRYEELPGRRGSTIDIPIPSAITAQAVSPSNTPPSTADMAPTEVNITLDQWFEAPFYLTDKELLEVMDGTIPMQASEAIKALANNVDGAILDLYKKIYGFSGVAGTTPFASDLTEYVNARKALDKQLADRDDRRVVIDPDAEANALLLRAFQDASFRGDVRGIIDGQIGRKLGADWNMDQNIKTHTTGTLSDGTDMLALVNGTPSIGDKTLDADETTLTGTVVEGDVFTIAGDTQTYVITAGATASGNAITLVFEPGLKVAPADDAQITFKAAHVANLLFHRDAFALVTRPLADNTQGLGNMVQSAVDPVSGLALRLEVSREHKRTRYSFDILYGTQCVRRELAARIAG